MKSTRQEVYKVIDAERDYQDSLSSDRTDGRDHHSGDFIVMMNYYINKLNEAWTINAGDTEALKVMRKIAGIAVHCMEKHGAINR